MKKINDLRLFGIALGFALFALVLLLRAFAFPDGQRFVRAGFSALCFALFQSFLAFRKRNARQLAHPDERDRYVIAKSALLSLKIMNNVLLGGCIACSIIYILSPGSPVLPVLFTLFGTLCVLLLVLISCTLYYEKHS